MKTATKIRRKSDGMFASTRGSKSWSKLGTTFTHKGHAVTSLKVNVSAPYGNHTTPTLFGTPIADIEIVEFELVESKVFAVTGDNTWDIEVKEKV